MEKNLGFFPLFINLSGKKILIVGAGNIAVRRIRTLLDFGCVIQVVAPDIAEEILLWQSRLLLSCECRVFQAEDIEGAHIVIAATNQEAVNNLVYEECKKKEILVNNVSDKEKCDFYFPGIVKEEELVIGITASGSNHKLAREVTEQIKVLRNKQK